MTRHIPITILGGYLGAGKTTVINHLLSGDHGVRIAVLVNDFGAVNVDASLIAETTDDSIALTNGCVCCSIADDLGEALDAQTARAEPPDHIVIEASGVAEPARIAAYAQGWPGVALNNVVTVADAETVQDRSTDKYVGGVVKRQIEAAGLILLSKGDLAGDERARSLKAWLKKLNSDAQIISADHGKIEADLLLERQGPVLADASGHSAAPLFNRLWQPAAPVRIEAVSHLLKDAGPDLHRAKGFLNDAETGERVLLQAVGERVEVETLSTGVTDEGLVLIGPDVAELDRIMAALDGCVMQG